MIITTRSTLVTALLRPGRRSSINRLRVGLALAIENVTTTGLWRIAGVAAALAVALLVHIEAADADDLSDIKANLALMQKAQFAPGSTGGTAYGTKAAPGAPLVGGSFPRSFLIPGTDTSIRIGGFADLTVQYFLQNGPANGTPSTTVGIGGNLETQSLNVQANTTVPGYGKGFVVPVQIQQSRGNGIFQETQQNSRFSVETRTPTAWGEARTFFEMDFKGCNNFSCNNVEQVSTPLVPRLRYFYGSLGGFLAGQVNSNFRDADAEPEILALNGAPGQAGPQRTPQVRYTYKGPWGSAWSFALEAPQTDALTPAGQVTTDTNLAQFPVINKTPSNVTCEANGVSIPGTTACALASNPAMSKAPDLTFASYWAQPWGHVAFRAVLRDLTWNDGQFVDRSLLGYGGGVSGDFLPGWFGWAKDDVTWQINAGNGIGRYLVNQNGGGLAANYVVAPGCTTPTTSCALAATNILVTTIPAVGGVVGYLHWWTPSLRSTIAYGIARFQVPSQLVGPIESTVANKQLQSASVNLIWSPVAFIDIGGEYFWGQRQVVAGLFGTEQVLIGEFRVKF
jgi:hypothetical protein